MALFQASMGCIELDRPWLDELGFSDGSPSPQITMTGWWFGTFSIFPYIGNVIIPIDFHIFQRGRSTTNQIIVSRRMTTG